MKDKVLCITRSLGILFLLTVLFSLIFSLLYYFQIISQNTFHILNWIFAILAYGIAGIMLGMGINKKALLHAFGITMVLALFGFLMMNSYTLMNILEFMSKLIMYNIGCILALNFHLKH